MLITGEQPVGFRADTRRMEDLIVHFRDYETLDGSKERLVARVGDGSIVTRFDKTPIPTGPNDVVCPHFLELKWATGCPYRCAWCYLQGTFRFLDYKTRPRPKDFDRVAKHLNALFEGDGVKPELLNAGELSDSMITEQRKRPFSRFVMELIGTQETHKILFVTKSPEIGNLLEIDNPHQAVVSFSINAEPVATQWEKAPRVADRIEAAGLLKDAGFEVRIRIDPMVPIEGWNEAYSDLVDRVFDRLRPDRITLGSLRGLQSTINNARDRSWLPYLDERSNWGKKVAFATRKEMYESVIKRLGKDFNYRDVALCKETVEIWEELGMDYRKVRCNCTR
jgi:spore photoproduct lyase